MRLFFVDGPRDLCVGLDPAGVPEYRSEDVQGRT